MSQTLTLLVAFNGVHSASFYTDIDLSQRPEVTAYPPFNNRTTAFYDRSIGHLGRQLMQRLSSVDGARVIKLYRRRFELELNRGTSADQAIADATTQVLELALDRGIEQVYIRFMDETPAEKRLATSQR